MREPVLKTIKITICDLCLEGVGEECHTPGCALYLHRVDLPIQPEQYEEVSEEAARPTSHPERRIRNAALEEAAAKLMADAERHRAVWRDGHPGRRLDCSTTDGALEYGRAQGMEMAAQSIRSLIEETGE